MTSFADLLVGPHGVDRYLELIRPSLTISDARAEVIGVRRQTPRSVTLTLRPNRAFSGFRAGQFIRVGVEIDGVRRTRTYSPASSTHCAAASLELTATLRDNGLVSRHLRDRIQPGAILHIDRQGSGDFVLPEERPTHLVLITGGSGITPVMSMLRTLADERYSGGITFIHYARTRADFLYRSEVEALSHVDSHFVATREGGGRFDRAAVPALRDLPADAYAAVCGPPALIDAVRGDWPDPDRVIAETFTPPNLTVTGEQATGQLRFLDSNRTAAITAGTLLEQAEASGLTPAYGCRMGICRTCKCRKAAGTVTNILTGETSEEEDEDIQLCISVPAGDVALEI